MKAVIILDFDNYFPKQMSEYPAVRLESFFSSIISEILKTDMLVSEIIIRLYGGWYQGTGYSKKASELQIALQGISLFPIFYKNKRINGLIEIAEQMYGINYTWLDTFQEKVGLQKVKIDWTRTGNSCTHSAPTCPVKILSNFIQNKNHHCSNLGCGVVQSDVFYRREQKLIDTMMTCDVISYTEEIDVASVYVVSDDIDLFPSIALSKAKSPSKRIVMVIKNQLMYSKYQNILSTFNAEVINL